MTCLTRSWWTSFLSSNRSPKSTVSTACSKTRTCARRITTQTRTWSASQRNGHTSERTSQLIVCHVERDTARGGGISPIDAAACRATGIYSFVESVVKATSWSTIRYVHISATTQQIITKFSAVATYVKWRQSWKFQFICIWVTMLTKYIILPIRGKVAK